MWWKLAALATGTVALLLLLFAQIVPMKVEFPLPHGADPARFAVEVSSAVELTNTIVTPVIVFVILAVAAWLGWRIVRPSRRRL